MRGFVRKQESIIPVWASLGDNLGDPAVAVAADGTQAAYLGVSGAICLVDLTGGDRAPRKLLGSG